LELTALGIACKGVLFPTSVESHVYGIQATPACMARRRQ